MKEPNDVDKLHKKREPSDEFERRVKRIRDRLDQADEIFDNLQTKQNKPDKATNIFQDVFEPIERGIKRFFSTSFSHLTKSPDGQGRQRSEVRENLDHYLLSCSDEELAAIRSRIDKILEERGFTES